jgi:aldehyde dehydrogenase (NAD+)
MSVADILDSMDYGPSPEAELSRERWLKRHADGFGHFIGGTFVAPGKAAFRRDQPGRAHTSPASRREPSLMSMPPSPPPARRKPMVKTVRPRARQTPLCACPPCPARERFFAVLEAMDNGKPSARRATSMCRWWRAISITMPAGPAAESEFKGHGPVTASAARSSRGTSRCSCWHGRSRRHWRSATRWC